MALAITADPTMKCKDCGSALKSQQGHPPFDGQLRRPHFHAQGNTDDLPDPPYPSIGLIEPASSHCTHASSRFQFVCRVLFPSLARRAAGDGTEQLAVTNVTLSRDELKNNRQKRFATKEDGENMVFVFDQFMILIYYICKSQCIPKYGG